MKHKTHSEMESLIALYKQYGGTKKSFCAEQGINPHTFYYWQRKLGDSTIAEKTNKFIPLQIATDRFNGQIELSYPNGNKLLLPMNSPINLLQTLIRTGV